MKIVMANLMLASLIVLSLVFTGISNAEFALGNRCRDVAL